MEAAPSAQYPVWIPEKLGEQATTKQKPFSPRECLRKPGQPHSTRWEFNWRIEKGSPHNTINSEKNSQPTSQLILSDTRYRPKLRTRRPEISMYAESGSMYFVLQLGVKEKKEDFYLCIWYYPSLWLGPHHGIVPQPYQGVSYLGPSICFPTWVLRPTREGTQAVWMESH